MAHPSPRSAIRVGPFEIDTASGEVFGRGETVRLQPQALALLLILLETPGRIVTREELRRRLWPDTAVDFEDGLNHAVARLREALGDSAQAPTLVETIPRRGYRFVGPVETGQDESPSGPQASNSRASTPDAPPVRADARRARRNRRAWTAFGLIAIAAAGAGAWLAAARDRPHPGIRSIAVLPLANLSSDRTQDYFADGITEELITELARIGSLRVVSRTSTLHFRESKKTVPQIARELGVDAVVEGSVQRAGERVRVAVQLIRGSPEEHLWAEAYEARVEDVLVLRTQVAADIGRQVGRQLPKPAGAVRRVPAAAHEAYLLGWSFAQQSTREGYEKSIRYFERAVAIDPLYALAYAQLAESNAMLDYLDDRRGEHFEKARLLARRAVELDPRLAEARLREADLEFYWNWDWSQCDAGFRAARDLNPASADAQEHYALCLSQLGRDDEALREFKRALELEPLSPRSHTLSGDLLYRAGRREEAIEAYRRAMDLKPNVDVLWRLARVLLDASRGEEALEALTAASRLAGEPAEKAGAFADVLARGGPPALLAEAHAFERRLLLRRRAELEARAPTGHVSPYARAALHARLGEVDEAFALLEQALRERSPRLAGIRFQPLWDPLRSDPRFAQLLRRMKLPEA